MGLTVYYRKFIQNYGVIAAPLPNLLRKNGFQWNAMALESFNALESALIFAPVLRLPNFDEQFIVECDASGGGIVAMLQQNHHIAFYS